MADIKGVLLNAWMSFLNEQYGEAAVETAKADLPDADRFLLARPLLDSSWYPLTTLDTIGKLTRPLAKSGGPDFSRQIGRFMAQYAFTGVYRPLLAKTPLKQVKKFSETGEFFFRETRRLEAEPTGESSSVARYFYESGVQPRRGMCPSLVGFWSRTLEMAGGFNVNGEHTACVLKGDKCCEFVFEWSMRPGPAK